VRDLGRGLQIGHQRRQHALALERLRGKDAERDLTAVGQVFGAMNDAQRPAADLLVEHRGVAQLVAATAVLGRDHDPEPSELSGLLPEIRRQRRFDLLKTHDHVDRRLALHEAARGAAEHLLAFGQR